MPTSRSMMLPAVVSFIAVFMARADVKEQLPPDDAIHMLQRRAVMKPTVECDGSDCELRSSQTHLEVSTQAEGLLQKGASNITKAACPTSLGPAEQFYGKSWGKVVNILHDRSHIDSGSTANKFSDAEINSLRGTGLFRFVCGGTAGYVSGTESFDSTSSIPTLFRCGSSPAGSFGTNRYGGHHRAIDCWNSGIHIIYQHDGTNGCWGPGGPGQTGELYVECIASATAEPTPAPTAEPTASPTPAPTPEDCADGTCTIADDPHITVFDGKLISLVQAGERHRLARGKFDASSVHMLKRLIADGETGDMWLVKSGKVSIQARYVRDDTLPEDNLFVGAVAVGGEFMNGNKLIIGALDDNVTYNGNEILGAQESKFEVSGLIKAERHVQARLVQNTDSINPGIDVELPEGVKLLINRQGHYINVQIKMPPAEGGQDGFCGNFNGNGDDDSLEFIEARNPRVAESDSLFA